ncbi:MAG TPA: hypothetical protein VKN99_08605 [Polyangia bacterium]|nr:hypothetical protein [Polyangia bacterium]
MAMRTSHKTALGTLIVIAAICLTWYSCREKPAQQVAVAPPSAPAVDAAPASAPVPAASDAAATAAEAAKTEKEASGGAPKEPRRGGARAARTSREKPPPTEVAAQVPPAPDAAPVAPPDAAEPAEAIPRLKMPPRKLARVAIRHHNQMGPSFHLVDVTYLLDGRPIFERHDEKGTGELERVRDLDAFDQNIDNGMHTLTVQLAYRASTFGVFRYAEGYRFRVRSSVNFTTNPGRVTEVAVNGYEKGNVNTPLEERPAVKFDVKFTDSSR